MLGPGAILPDVVQTATAAAPAIEASRANGLPDAHANTAVDCRHMVVRACTSLLRFADAAAAHVAAAMTRHHSVTVEEPLEDDSPLWSLENLLITSHTGGETSLYEERLVDILVENTGRWERGEEFQHRIV